jgi:hypothetical protein
MAHPNHQPPSPLGVWITGAMSHRVTGLPPGTLPSYQTTISQAYHLTICTLALHLSHNLTATRLTGAKPPSHQAHRCQTIINHQPPDTRGHRVTDPPLIT